MGSRKLTTTEKLLLWRIWDFDGRRFGRHRACYASVAHLADELGLAEKTIKGLLSDLTAIELIRSTAHGRGRQRTIVIPRDAHPRSGGLDDMMRARQIFDSVLSTKRNDLANWKRQKKRRRVPAPSPIGSPLPDPYMREKEVGENPTPPHPGEVGDLERGKPVSLGALLRHLGRES